MLIKWLINEGINQDTTSLLARNDFAIWVNKAVCQMKEEQRIIQNAWLKMGFEWFDKGEREGDRGC
jgi:hypothetical protein